MHPKFDLTGVQTLNLQIMDSAFYVPETLTLTTEPSGALFYASVHSSVPSWKTGRNIYPITWAIVKLNTLLLLMHRVFPSILSMIVDVIVLYNDEIVN